MSSAPTEFQRSIKHYMAGLRDTICLPYLDNLVHSSNFEEHFEHICLVLQHYQKHGVKLTQNKCDLFKRSVRFLGKLVTGPNDDLKGKETCNPQRGASNARFSLFLQAFHPQLLPCSPSTLQPG